MLYVLSIVPTWLVVPYPVRALRRAPRGAAAPPRGLLHLLRRRAGDLRVLLSGVRPHEAPLVRGQLHDRRDAGRPAEGRRLVVRRVGRSPARPGRSAASSRCSCSARRRPRTSPTWKATARTAASRCRSGSACARAARIMAPFFVVPWLLIPIFTWLPGGLAADRKPGLPDRARPRPRRLGRLHGAPAAARPGRAGLDREPPRLDPHVPDADVRAGRLCRWDTSSERRTRRPASKMSLPMKDNAAAPTLALPAEEPGFRVRWSGLSLSFDERDAERDRAPARRPDPGPAGPRGPRRGRRARRRRCRASLRRAALGPRVALAAAPEGRIPRLRAGPRPGALVHPDPRSAPDLPRAEGAGRACSPGTATTGSWS